MTTVSLVGFEMLAKQVERNRCGRVSITPHGARYLIEVARRLHSELTRAEGRIAELEREQETCASQLEQAAAKHLAQLARIAELEAGLYEAATIIRGAAADISEFNRDAPSRDILSEYARREGGAHGGRGGA